MLDRNVTVIAHSVQTPDQSWSFKPALFSIALSLPKKVWNFLSTLLLPWGVLGPENSNIKFNALDLHSFWKALFSPESSQRRNLTLIPAIFKSVNSSVIFSFKSLFSFKKDAVAFRFFNLFLSYRDFYLLSMSHFSYSNHRYRSNKLANGNDGESWKKNQG